MKTPAIGALLVQCARGSSVMIGSGECYDLAQAVIRWSTCATSRAGRCGRRRLSELGRHTGSNERPRIRRCGTNAGPGTARPLVLGKGKQRSANTTDARYPFVIKSCACGGPPAPCYSSPTRSISSGRLDDLVSTPCPTRRSGRVTRFARASCSFLPLRSGKPFAAPLPTPH
jgi:hypothetical protein